MKIHAGIDSIPSTEVERPSERAQTQARRDKVVRSTIDQSPQTLFEYDPATAMFSLSDASFAVRLFGPSETANGTGYSLSTINGHIIGEAPSARAAAIAEVAQSYTTRFQLVGNDGGTGWFEERGGWIGLGKSRRLIGVLTSIDKERAEAEALSRRAEFDELTGVLNRTRLRERLDDVVAAIDRSELDRAGAYLVAGIDDVGGINADFGFVAADAVIREVASRLAAVLGDVECVGRVAGTKFGVIVANANAAEIREVCIRLLNVVREQVVETERGSVAASICLGAINLCEAGANPHIIMAQAEAALDEAKRMGRSSWSSFSETTDVVSMRKRNSRMSDVILTALNDRRIDIAFQPIVSDIKETPRKFECLVRMRDENGVEVPAPEFIPAAERLGLVHLLDRRVLELSINTLEAVPEIELNVNISLETVRDPVWAEGYLSLLRANAQLAKRICVELTETRVIDAADASIDFVSEIKSLGAKFAMDDFGAGYTSFRNLKALDIDILKIDGSFVSGVSTSRDNQLFVRTLLDLARNFGMMTVAEWVDNEADALLLKGLGVDYLQGFMIGRPETKPVWLPNGAPNAPPIVHG
ncbi:MAG: EAL domain-containing protein [Alphaproteobacteria bacterium]|nr:EAL domain-containing protein [Alphaproteobacteria bacterium]